MEAPAGRWRFLMTHLSYEDPEQLLAHPYNWRIHAGHQRAAMEAALSEIGWAGVVLVNDVTGNVLDGHLRVDLAIQAQEPAVPVLHLEATEEQEKLILATYDPLGALAVADRAKLTELLAETRPAHEALQTLLQDQAVRYREGRVSDAFRAFLENEMEPRAEEQDRGDGPWLDEDEDEDDEDDDAEADPEEVTAFALTHEQRVVVLDALYRAKATSEAETLADALTWLCQWYLDRQMPHPLARSLPPDEQAQTMAAIDRVARAFEDSAPEPERLICYGDPGAHPEGRDG
jgi:hypothetical protein